MLSHADGGGVFVLVSQNWGPGTPGSENESSYSQPATNSEVYQPYFLQAEKP